MEDELYDLFVVGFFMGIIGSIGLMFLGEAITGGILLASFLLIGLYIEEIYILKFVNHAKEVNNG